MIEAISATYGAAVNASTEITVPSVYGNDETLKVIARWEDANWSFNLVRFQYETSFAPVAFSKRLHDEAVRLDRQEALQRALESREKEDQEKRLEQEKSRQANRPCFRP